MKPAGGKHAHERWTRAEPKAGVQRVSVWFIYCVQGEAPSAEARKEGADALVELEEAYATLHNQRTREKYDRLGYDGEPAPPLPPGRA